MGVCAFVSAAVPRKQPAAQVRVQALDIEINNQCACLLTNAIIYYNSAILSRLLRKCEAEGNVKVVELIKNTSPVAWRHIHMNRHNAFHGNSPPPRPSCHRCRVRAGLGNFRRLGL
jgi:hypothetical protein